MNTAAVGDPVTGRHRHRRDRSHVPGVGSADLEEPRLSQQALEEVGVDGRLLEG
jgi:hypothetical protein